MGAGHRAVCRNIPIAGAPEGSTLAPGVGMRDFIRAFVRDEYGAWRCIEPAELDLPGGRIQVTPGSVFVRGTRFMNVDLAELLDRQRDENAR